jgi:hypothetical protein
MRVSLAPALVFIATATDQSFLLDFWQHLARGRAMLAQGKLIDQELFTFTVPGRQFEDVNWLPQLLYARLYDRGGLALVQVLNSVVLAAMMGLLIHLAWRKSGSAAIAGAAGVFAFFGLWQALAIRPQSFSFLLFVVLYEVLEASERRQWLLVLCPFILALWANVHGAFPAGLVLIGAFLAGACWDARPSCGGRLFRNGQCVVLAICLVASMAATLVSPYGWRVYHFVSNTSTVAGGRPIGEWLPPTLDLFIGKFWVASLAIMLTVFALPGARPTAREVFLIICFLLLSASSVRMIAWWVLVITPILARLVAANWPNAKLTQPEKPAFASALCFGVIVLMVLMSLPGLSQANPLLGPARRAGRVTERDLNQVIRWLADHKSSGRIYSRFEWGAYLVCHLGSAYPVFMDGRIDIYPDEVWNQYAVVSRGQTGWQGILDLYKVDFLLLDANYHAESGLLAEAERSKEWQEAYRAGQAIVFVKRAPLAAP